jgi:hypothetical protein
MNSKHESDKAKFLTLSYFLQISYTYRVEDKAVSTTGGLASGD